MMFKIVTKGVTVDMTTKRREAFDSLKTCSDGSNLYQVGNQGRDVKLLATKGAKAPVAAEAAA